MAKRKWNSDPFSFRFQSHSNITWLTKGVHKLCHFVRLLKPFAVVSPCKLQMTAMPGASFSRSFILYFVMIVFWSKFKFTSATTQNSVTLLLRALSLATHFALFLHTPVAGHYAFPNFVAERCKSIFYKLWRAADALNFACNWPELIYITNWNKPSLPVMAYDSLSNKATVVFQLQQINFGCQSVALSFSPMVLYSTVRGACFSFEWSWV